MIIFWWCTYLCNFYLTLRKLFHLFLSNKSWLMCIKLIWFKRSQLLSLPRRRSNPKYLFDINMIWRQKLDFQTRSSQNFSYLKNFLGSEKSRFSPLVLHDNNRNIKCFDRRIRGGMIRTQEKKIITRCYITSATATFRLLN
jgi:hypothetical protein